MSSDTGVDLTLVFFGLEETASEFSSSVPLEAMILLFFALTFGFEVVESS